MKTIVILGGGALAGALALSACHSTSSTGAGASSTSSGSGGAGGAPSCPPPDPTAFLTMTLTGTVAGAPINDVFGLDTEAATSDDSAIFTYEPASCGGATVLLAATAVYPPDGGACIADNGGCDSSMPCCNNNCDPTAQLCQGPGAYAGLFRLPTGGSDGGEWFCANQGNASVDPTTGVDFTVSSFVKLGACPGTSVSGSVTLCAATGINGDHTACSGNDSAMTSTLAGASFAWTNPVRVFGIGELGGPYAEGFVSFNAPPSTADGAGSQLLVELGQVSVLPSISGPLTGGVLRIGPGNPDAGAVYCIGGGTLVQTPDQTKWEVTFTNLSRLGTCSGTPIDGSLTGHVVTSP